MGSEIFPKESRLFHLPTKMHDTVWAQTPLQKAKESKKCPFCVIWELFIAKFMPKWFLSRKQVTSKGAGGAAGSLVPSLYWSRYACGYFFLMYSCLKSEFDMTHDNL